MKNTLIIYLLLCCTLSVTAQNNCTTEHHGALEIAFPLNKDLPENIDCGLNGRMIIYGGYDPNQDGTNPATNPTALQNVTFEENIIKNFALIVAGSTYTTTDASGNSITVEHGGGIVSRDLGIGSSDLYTNLPDYVFEENYKITSLQEVEAFVRENKHLPGVIGKQELSEQGYFLVDRMLLAQLKNLEELFLHTIAQEKQIKAQEEENKKLKALAEALEKRLQALENKTD